MGQIQRRPNSVYTEHFAVEGRGGHLDVLELEGDDCAASIVRGAGGNRLTYEEARALANGLLDHPGPLSDELVLAITTFLAGT